MVERWNNGMMGFGEERKYFLYVCPLFQYSIIPLRRS
jgi:hypothetical protein